MASLITHEAAVVLFLVICGIFTSQVNGSLLDPDLIARELQEFANDALGVDDLQVRKQFYQF